MSDDRTDDRGLEAIERVRGVRERDSRIGLRQSVDHRAARLLAADLAVHRLAATPAFVHGSGGDLVATRAVGARMADAATAARTEAETATRLAAEATSRWQQDKTRLRTVELLLERRAEQRAARRRRAEDHELDDIAGQGWLRRRGRA